MKMMFFKGYSRKKFVFFLSVFLISGFVWIGSKRTMINSEPYKVALKFVKSDEQISHEFGQIAKVGLPSGSIEQSLGRAVFYMRVEGNLKTEKIQVTVRKTEFGVWFIESWKIK